MKSASPQSTTISPYRRFAYLYGKDGRIIGIHILPFIIWSSIMLIIFYWLTEMTYREMLSTSYPKSVIVPPVKRNVTLSNYFNEIRLLYDPPVTCENNVTVIILVSSFPKNFKQREAIRNTWGQNQRTYFVLGLDKQNTYDTLIENFIENDKHRDLIIFEIMEHDQNLTLKAMLMLQWTYNNCPRAKFVCRADDEMLINPWILGEVVDDNRDAGIVGHKVIIRDEQDNSRWRVPWRWFENDKKTEYITSETAYLVNGKYVEEILIAGKKLGVKNLEGVYITCLVSKFNVNFKVVHDKRLSIHQPGSTTGCAYWSMASSPGYNTSQLTEVWPKLSGMAQKYEKDVRVCDFYKSFGIGKLWEPV